MAVKQFPTGANPGDWVEIDNVRLQPLTYIEVTANHGFATLEFRVTQDVISANPARALALPLMFPGDATGLRARIGEYLVLMTGAVLTETRTEAEGDRTTLTLSFRTTSSAVVASALL